MLSDSRRQRQREWARCGVGRNIDGPRHEYGETYQDPDRGIEAGQRVADPVTWVHLRIQRCCAAGVTAASARSTFITACARFSGPGSLTNKLNACWTST